MKLFYILWIITAISACASLKPTTRLISSPSLEFIKVSGTSFTTADGSPFYVHGVNLPWLDGSFGSYLAPSYSHPEWGVQYRHDLMFRRLTQIKSLNVNTVRLFLSGDLQGYKFDGSGKVTGLDPVFFKNLDDTIKIAQSLSLKVYLVILEGLNGHADMTQVEQPIFLNSEIQNSFQNNIVRVIARRYAGNPTIFAFDVLNESNAEVKDILDWKHILNLIKNTAQTIHSEDPQDLFLAA